MLERRRHELQEAAVVAPRDGMSWVNRAVHFVDGLPVPDAICYAAAGLVALSLFVVNDWLSLGRPLEAIRPFHVVLALEPVYALGLMHLLDIQARRALKRMRPLIAPPEIYDSLHLQLIALPARPTLIASLIGMLVGLAAVPPARVSLPDAFRPFLAMGAARSFVEVWLVFTWFVFGALFIHTVHQLRTINFIYVRHAIIDLDYYQPLFHFSRVSGLTAIGLIVIPYVWYIAVPNLVREPMGVAFGGCFRPLPRRRSCGR